MKNDSAIRWGGALALCLTFLSASAHATSPINARKVAAGGVSQFGFNLAKSLYEKKTGEPVAISPFSIAEAVSLVTHGAEKETKAELENLFGVDSEVMTTGLSQTRADLARFAKDSNGAFEFQSANALWGNSNAKFDFKFDTDFLKVAKDSYQAELTRVDFDGTTTVADINNWVKKKTNGKISTILNKLDADAVAVLVNAIYTKGRFAEHFSNLFEGGYKNQAGKAVRASYMKALMPVGFYEDKDVRAFSLAVQDPNSKFGGQVALDILAPVDGKLDSLLSVLDSAKYETAVAGLAPQELNLTIVAGKVEQTGPVSLTEVLQKKPFEVVRAFDDTAQFGKLGATKNKDPLYLSDIVTRTFYEVTPFGFEAAASTAITVAAATALPLPPTSYTISGPSVHVIRHIPSGTPLFISVYDSPQLYSEAKLVELVETGVKTQRYVSAKIKTGNIVAQYNYETGKSKIVLEDSKGNVLKVYKTL